MLRHQLVPGDVDQQILLLEVFADAPGDAAEQAHGGRRDGRLRDEDAGVEVVLVDEVVEGADLLRADAGRVGAEFDVDGAAVGLGVGVRFAGQGGIFGLHGFGGTRADFHFIAAVPDETVSDCGGPGCWRREAYSGYPRGSAYFCLKSSRDSWTSSSVTS